MGKMTLKDGKFWIEGKIVPIEIGNSEQIALLKKVERKNQELIDGEFELELDVVKTWTGSFACICSNSIHVEFESYHNFSSDLEDNIDREEVKCRKCKRIYEVNHDHSTEDGVLIIFKQN